MDVHELPLGQLLARTRWDTQAFFHCPKYIKTRIPGLTGAVASPSETSSLREEPVVVCRV
jgi:hypothetical protein